MAWLLAACLLATTSIGQAQGVNLNNLRAGHPRRLLTPAEVLTRRGLIVSDPYLRQQYANLVSQGTTMLAEPALQYTIVNDRLLEVSREALGRIRHVAALHSLFW